MLNVKTPKDAKNDTNDAQNDTNDAQTDITRLGQTDITRLGQTDITRPRRTSRSQDGHHGAKENQDQ